MIVTLSITDKDLIAILSYYKLQKHGHPTVLIAHNLDHVKTLSLLSDRFSWRHLFTTVNSRPSKSKSPLPQSKTDQAKNNFAFFTKNCYKPLVHQQYSTVHTKQGVNSNLEITKIDAST